MEGKKRPLCVSAAAGAPKIGPQRVPDGGGGNSGELQERISTSRLFRKAAGELQAASKRRRRAELQLWARSLAKKNTKKGDYSPERER